MGVVMAIGTVKWFSDVKGYGFIATPEVDADVFVHFSSISMDGFRTLNPNDEVSFELVRADKGYLAQQVRSACASSATAPEVGAA